MRLTEHGQIVVGNISEYGQRHISQLLEHGTVVYGGIIHYGLSTLSGEGALATIWTRVRTGVSTGIGWFLPTGHTDSGGTWSNETYAYDDDDGTYAVETIS